MSLGHHRDRHLQLFGHAAGDCAELHRGEEGEERVGVGVPAPRARRASRHRACRSRAGRACRDRRIWSAWSMSVWRRLGCGTSPGAGEQRVEVSELADQEGRGLDTDARRAGDVVDRVTGQRLHVDHAFGRDAELGLHPRRGPRSRRSLHPGTQDLHAAPDKLHQVLVGGDDGDAPARVAARQESVAMMSSASNPSCSRQAMLKARVASRVSGICGRRSSGIPRGWPCRGRRSRCGTWWRSSRTPPRCGSAPRTRSPRGQFVPQDVAEPRDRAHRQPVGFPRQRRQRVVGAEDEGRSVDQVQVTALAEGRISHWSPPRLPFGFSGGGGGFRAGRVL
jgi:hypothetical protein